MKVAERLPLFTVVFAVVCSAVYVLAVWKNLALFTYHPATGEFGPGVQKGREGPPMYWYGWITTSVLAGGAAGLLACLLPRALAQRLWPGLAWAVPLLGMAFLVYILRNYFLH